MACIKSAQRAALTALAPEAPYLAAGTMSGAVDMQFSASANIEIFSLDFQSDSPDLPLLAAAPSPDRFNRLCWSRPGAADGDSFSLGLLAGGLSDGSVAVWNPLSMIRFARIQPAPPAEICPCPDLFVLSLLQLRGASGGRHGRAAREAQRGGEWRCSCCCCLDRIAFPVALMVCRLRLTGHWIGVQRAHTQSARFRG